MDPAVGERRALRRATDDRRSSKSSTAGRAHNSLTMPEIEEVIGGPPAYHSIMDGVLGRRGGFMYKDGVQNARAGAHL